jgi:hypothetical protein
VENIVVAATDELEEEKIKRIVDSLYGDGKFTALNKFSRSLEGLPETRIGSIQIRFTGRDFVPSPRSSSPNYYRRSAVWYLRC